VKEIGTSVLVLAEIRRSIELKRRQNAAQAEALDRWFARMRARIGDRVLPIDEPIAEAWALLGAPDPLPLIDGLLAATAKVHGLTLVTRNTAAILRTGVAIPDPFKIRSPLNESFVAGRIADQDGAERERRRSAALECFPRRNDAATGKTGSGPRRGAFAANLMEAAMERQSFNNVLDALEDTPAEAANMSMRSSLMIAIERRVRKWDVTRAEAARRLGITQPRLNDLLRGKIANFSLDTLFNLAAQAGLSVRLDFADAA
jgi:predicted XRE-type DNA-binding protein/predicted nucleic acid-binding protein